MKISGATNYELHTLSEIRKEFKIICSHSERIIILTKNVSWSELPVDLAYVFADTVGLAQRIQEEKNRNFLFLLGRNPSQSFISNLENLGLKAKALAENIGRIWHQGNYHSNIKLDILYSELRDFCYLVVDFNNIGFSLNKRFFNMEKQENIKIMAGGNITAGGDIVVGGKKEVGFFNNKNESLYNKPAGKIIIGVIIGLIVAGIVYFLGWG